MASTEESEMLAPQEVHRSSTEDVDTATFNDTHRSPLINDDSAHPAPSPPLKPFDNMLSSEFVGSSAPDSENTPLIVRDDTTVSSHPPPSKPTDTMKTPQPTVTPEECNMAVMEQQARSVASIGSFTEESSRAPARHQWRVSSENVAPLQRGTASREGSTGGETPTGQKRQAAGDPQQEPLKRPRIWEELQESEAETTESIKEKANRMLDKRDKTIRELELELALQSATIKALKKEAVENDSTLSEVEDERDEWKTEFYGMKKIQEARDANKRMREGEEKDARKAFEKQLKADKKKEYESKVSEKHKALNARYRGLLDASKAKHDEIVDELNALKRKSKKEVSDLTSVHREDIRSLREQIREANKHGAGKAREDLKDKVAELKDVQGTCERYRTEHSSMRSSLRLQETKLANAEMEKQQCREIWGRQCSEMKDLEMCLTELKKQYNTQLQKNTKLQLQFHQDLAELEKNKAQELQYANKRAELYHANQYQSQQNLVMQQRNSFSLKMANEKLLQEKQALELRLQGDSASQETAKAFEAMKAKLKICEQFAERSPDLKQILLRNSFLDQRAKQKDGTA